MRHLVEVFPRDRDVAVTLRGLVEMVKGPAGTHLGPIVLSARFLTDNFSGLQSIQVLGHVDKGRPGAIATSGSRATVARCITAKPSAGCPSIASVSLSPLMEPRIYRRGEGRSLYLATRAYLNVCHESHVAHGSN
ncbi:MAG: hypothetical protein OXM02_11175 [Bacteroidota bacterium]|nr:hypothetical protein [Bacteroidota bacterium]MDE2957171.1 hypothetical protein [Bacteroidota bacterium]